MADLSLTDDDREAIRGILLAERERGVDRPLLPADVDLDGDGVVDAFGLDQDDQVIVVSGVDLTETVYESDGDDINVEGAYA